MRHLSLILIFLFLMTSVTQPTAAAKKHKDDKYSSGDSITHLEAALRKSHSGKELLRALRQEGAAGVIAGLQMLTQELEQVVSDATALPVDTNDPRLWEAAGDLRRLPGGQARDPVIAVMALIDGWSRRASSSYSQLVPGGFIEQVRRSKWRSMNVREWLKLRFPHLFDEAMRILVFLT